MRSFKLFLVAAMTLVSLQYAQAQCGKCGFTLEDFTPDYCYSNEAFGDMCVGFKANEQFFALSGRKKTLQIPLGKADNTGYLLSIANDKKLKLSAKEILFIVEALKVWSVEEKKIGFEFTESSLGIKMLSEGSGKLPETGQKVTVHYIGTLEDGTKFDSSVDRGTPFSFPLGKGRVIKGWDEGIGLLKIGSKAVLRVPPELGYGNRGVGAIPPNSILYFEVELLEAQ